VFITLNAAGADNLRKRLKLSAHCDPTYSAAGSGNATLTGAVQLFEISSIAL